MRRIKIGVVIFFGLLLGYTANSFAYENCFQSVGSSETYNYYFFSDDMGEGNFALVGYAYKDDTAGQEPTHGNLISTATEFRMNIIRSGVRSGTHITTTLNVTMPTDSTVAGTYQEMSQVVSSNNTVGFVNTSGTFRTVDCP